MRTLLALGLVLGLTAVAGADDKKDDKKKADPTGSWKCEMESMGMKRTSTLKLKLDGDKLTGTVATQEGQEAKVEDGKFNDGEATFAVTRERNGMKITVNYKAKIDGDAIKGTATVNFNGDERKIEFEGKRVKDEKKDK
ncbi:MAG: hypothetical protein ABGY75_22705 [Gemmataceae bacterium]